MKSDRPSPHLPALVGLIGLAVSFNSAAAQSLDGRWRVTTSGTLRRS